MLNAKFKFKLPQFKLIFLFTSGPFIIILPFDSPWREICMIPTWNCIHAMAAPSSEPFLSSDSTIKEKLLMFTEQKCLYS